MLDSRSCTAGIFLVLFFSAGESIAESRVLFLSHERLSGSMNRQFWDLFWRLVVHIYGSWEDYYRTREKNPRTVINSRNRMPVNFLEAIPGYHPSAGSFWSVLGPADGYRLVSSIHIMAVVLLFFSFMSAIMWETSAYPPVRFLKLWQAVRLPTGLERERDIHRPVGYIRWIHRHASGLDSRLFPFVLLCVAIIQLSHYKKKRRPWEWLSGYCSRSSLKRFLLAGTSSTGWD